MSERARIPLSKGVEGGREMVLKIVITIDDAASRALQRGSEDAFSIVRSRVKSALETVTENLYPDKAEFFEWDTVSGPTDGGYLMPEKLPMKKPRRGFGLLFQLFGWPYRIEYVNTVRFFRDTIAKMEVQHTKEDAE